MPIKLKRYLKTSYSRFYTPHGFQASRTDVIRGLRDRRGAWGGPTDATFKDDDQYVTTSKAMLTAHNVVPTADHRRKKAKPLPRSLREERFAGNTTSKEHYSGQQGERRHPIVPSDNYTPPRALPFAAETTSASAYQSPSRTCPRPQTTKPKALRVKTDPFKGITHYMETFTSVPHLCVERRRPKLPQPMLAVSYPVKEDRDFRTAKEDMAKSVVTSNIPPPDQRFCLRTSWRCPEAGWDLGVAPVPRPTDDDDDD
eukprot:Sspe_Gene.52218::Locus_28935_Transcript_1_1_Confidence_1.000_Length_1239::g.52218::m.52218